MMLTISKLESGMICRRSSIMDEHAHMERECGRVCGPGSLQKARKRVLERFAGAGFLVGEKDHALSLGKCERCGTVVEPRLSELLMVHQDSAIGAKGD